MRHSSQVSDSHAEGSQPVDLHLDDRLLHGRILHGWGRILKPRRYVLVSERLTDATLCDLYADTAAGSDTELCCFAPEQGAAPQPRENDFWLTDAPAAALWLLDAGPAYRRLTVIGLREATGPELPDGSRIGSESMARLWELAARGVTVRLQSFPGEAPRALPPPDEKP